MAAIGLSIKSLFEVGPSHLAYCARLGLVMTPITLAFLALINEIKSRQRKQAARNKSQTPCRKLLFVPVSTHQTKTESSEIRSREKKADTERERWRLLRSWGYPNRRFRLDSLGSMDWGAIIIRPPQSSASLHDCHTKLRSAASSFHFGAFYGRRWS